MNAHLQMGEFEVMPVATPQVATHWNDSVERTATPGHGLTHTGRPRRGSAHQLTARALALPAQCKRAVSDFCVNKPLLVSWRAELLGAKIGATKFQHAIEFGHIGAHVKCRWSNWKKEKTRGRKVKLQLTSMRLGDRPLTHSPDGRRRVQRMRPRRHECRRLGEHRRCRCGVRQISAS